MGKEADFEMQRKPHGIGQGIHEQVRSDLYDRALFGIQKYGEALKAFNGRDSLQDAYEEILDLAVYIKQKTVEMNLLQMRKFRLKSPDKHERNNVVTVLLFADDNTRVVFLNEAGEVHSLSSECFLHSYEEIPNNE